MNKNVDDFVECFNEVIVDYLDDKDEILVHLTGGYDTRSILSVLLFNDIKCKFLTGDFSINQSNDWFIVDKIVDKYDLNHKFVDNTKDYEDVFPDGYDVYLTGILMSEYLNRFNIKNFKNGYEECVLMKHIQRIYVLSKEFDVFIPLLDKKLFEYYKKISKCYLKNSIIQKSIIKRFYPELLDFEFTRYS